MVLEEIPTPIALLFAGYIIGAGYLAFLSIYRSEEFLKINPFDKFLISLIFGMLSFSIVIGMFQIDIDFSDNNSILSFIKSSPIIFVINVFIARVLMYLWNYVNDILSSFSS